MTRIGNRAFTALATLFELQDAETLGELDLRIGSPVFDLQSALVASIARYSRFTKLTAATAAGNPNSAVASPKNATHWTTIESTDGNGLAVPADHEMWIVNAAVFSSVAANFTNASYIQRNGTTSADLGLLEWNGELDGRGLLRAPYGPLAYPGIQMKILQQPAWNPRFNANVSGNTNVTLMLDVLSGPIGLWPVPNRALR